MDVRLRKLIFKTAIFAFSLSLAWWLIRGGYLNNLVSMVLPIKFAAEFLAGVFYVSFLTAPISLAMLLVLADINNPILTALLAGLGAAFGDLVIIKFFKERLSKDVNLVSRELQLKKFGIFTPLIGAIVVASPLPDELGLMLLGASKLSYRQIAVLTYILNTAGILLIVVPVNLLS